MAFDPLSAAFDFGGKLLDKFITSPADRAAAAQKMLEMQQNGELARMAQETELLKGQMEINKVEAASPLTFISGGRPSVIWVCSAALAVQYVLGPLFAWVSALVGHPMIAPKMDLSELFPLLLALLGVSSMRSYDKSNGVASK